MNSRVNRPTVLVVAAVIEKDGLVLLGQRRRDDSHPLKWEFPGGKVEEGETPRDGLKRELQEELSINAEIGPEISRHEFKYPRRSRVLLIFHRVTKWRGEMRNGAFEQILWEQPARLPEYDFLEGDVDFVRRLARGQL
jgi:8-oxo-dGTP diphosphatase